MDPLVNRNFTLLQEKVTGLEKKLQTAHEDLQAVQFDPNNTSFAGKQLIARCRRLKEENEELGKKQAEGDSGPLKTQIKLQKSEIERLNAQLAEEWEFELELGEELNKLQEKLFQVEKGTGTGSTADEKTEQGVVGNASTTTVAATDIAKSASDSTEQKAPDVAVVTSSDSTEVKTTDAAMATASD
jgi:chromosome segregation ATPase